MKNKKPGSYRINNGCHNCGHVFDKQEYDEGPDYHCAKMAHKRPTCGSVFLDEHWLELKDAAYTQAMIDWDEWSDGRRVEAWGGCGEWIEQSKPDSTEENTDA